MEKINVHLGLDSATFSDGRVKLSEYATAVGKIVRPQYPDLKFSFDAVEDDNAGTHIDFPDSVSQKQQDEITESVANAEGECFADESLWIAV